MKALIVGIGRMGDRYVKTLNKIAGENLQLYTVDPANQVESAKAHYADLSEVPKDMEFDLAIDARPNFQRFEVLSDLVERKIPRILIEKPHAQSLAESQKMMDLVNGQSDSKIMVPFYRRFSHLFDHNEFAKLNAGDLKLMVTTAGAIGLGCNGVHFMDAANSLLGDHPTNVYASLHLDSIESPRGEQFCDHSGTLVMEYPNGGKYILNILHDSSAGSATKFYFEKGKVIQHEQQEPNWFWYSVPDEHKDLPYYRTHMDKQVEPNTPYGLDLFKLMEEGITTFMETPDKVPGLDAAHNVLSTIALAVASSENGQRINWDEAKNLGNIEFKFT